jgi:hypothetical protein
MANEKWLIDANEAKKFAREYLANPYEIISTCAVIDSTPTVDAVEVVHGRWMVNNQEAICSACKFTTFEWAEWTFNYCPNCGARMDA